MMLQLRERGRRNHPQLRYFGCKIVARSSIPCAVMIDFHEPSVIFELPSRLMLGKLRPTSSLFRVVPLRSERPEVAVERLRSLAIAGG